MPETLLAAATLLTAAGMTYLFCIRPMRTSRCATGLIAQRAAREERRRELAEIDLARAQLAALRAAHGPAEAHQGPRETGIGTETTGTETGPRTRQA